MSTGRFGIAVILATVGFYTGPLMARFSGKEPGSELMMSLAFAAVGGLLPAIALQRYPEQRAGMGYRIPASIALMLGAAGLRHYLLYQAQWSGQALSGVTFLVLLAVGLIYVFPVESDPDP